MENGLKSFDFLKENSSFGIQERFVYFDDSLLVPMQFSAILNSFSESSTYDKEVSQKFVAERMLSFMPAHFIYSQNLVSPEVMLGNADIMQVLSNFTLSPRLKANALSPCHESQFHESGYNNLPSKINDNLSEFNILNAMPCFKQEYKDFFSGKLNISAGKNIIRYNNYNSLEIENSLIKGAQFEMEDNYG